MRGFLIGALVLTALDAAVSSVPAAGRAAALLSIPTSIVTYIVSPTKPAIPDLRKHKPSSTGPADNPFAAATANMQAISAAWSTQAQAPAPAGPAVQSTAQYLLGVNA